MSAFTKPLDLRYVDGKWWDVIADLPYHVGGEDSDEVILVEAGFRTDLGSIPRISWSVIGHPAGKYAPACVTHDKVYQYPANGVDEPRSRRRCDQVFLEGMQVLGVSWWRRSTMYAGVRCGGWVKWKEYRQKEFARILVARCVEHNE